MSDSLEWYYTLEPSLQAPADKHISGLCELGIPTEEAIAITYDQYINGDVVFYGEE